MGFLSYLFIGTVAYSLGWAIQVYILDKNHKLESTTNQPSYDLKHPIILSCLAVFFVIMLAISTLIGRFLLEHNDIDILFVLVNSAVATFVFGFGLIPDHSRHELPD